ncbi:MAG: pantoate--beta-alanine ligase [Deltaproteobacteria bacterium]|nr:pantoate--beta-alanine ligase [Deltaproteobacteria bacterium]
MLILHTPQQMRTQSAAWRAAGETIALVPTMGALHDGHASLLRGGRERAARLVASIFANPTQFGPQEDFSKYPRPLNADLGVCRDCGCDAVFVPTADAIYPPGDQTVVEVTELSRPLCGTFRPGHFRGVATVVYKLLQLVAPDCALFGEKDYQQLQVINQMVRDLWLPVTIIPMPIIREPDGLAMSSRNRYLSPEERRQATAIPQALQQIVVLAAQTRDAARLVAAGRELLASAGIQHIDYLEIVDATSLAALTHLDRPARACIAAHIGTTRLIDNVAVAVPTPLC